MTMMTGTEPKTMTKQEKRAQKTIDAGLVQRAVNIRLVAPDPATFKRAMTIIRAHRRICNKMLALAGLAETAGAEITKGKDGAPLLNINNDRTKALLSALLMDTKIEDVNFPDSKKPLPAFITRAFKAPYYEFRQFFLDLSKEFHTVNKDIPEFGYWIFEESNRTIKALHQKKIPDFNDVRRHKLQTNAIMRPVNTAGIGIVFKRLSEYKCFFAFLEQDDKSKWVRLRLSEDPKDDLKLLVEGDYVSSKGPKHKDMDFSHQYLWRKFTEGVDGWDFQSPSLNERDGILSLQIPYRRPAERAIGLNKTRKMQVVFAPQTDDRGESFIHCLVEKAIAGPKADKWRRFSLYINEPLALLKQLEAQSYKAGLLPSSVPRRYRKMQRNKGALVSLRRTRIEKDFNHVWSRTIIQRAVNWGCGEIVVYSLPSGKTEKSDNPLAPQAGGIGNGMPWQWSQFLSFIQYKAAEAGVVVSEQADADLGEMIAALKKTEKEE